MGFNRGINRMGDSTAVAVGHPFCYYICGGMVV